MRTNIDPLFELIKSLTQGEKRHFSIYAKRHVVGGQNNYKLLFEEIDKQQVFNEEKLMRKFAGQKTATNFSASKHQLYQLILDSLKVFHADKNIDSELRGLLEKISILFNKGLIKQCQKLTQKTKKLAQDHERYSMLLDVISWERKLHSKELYKEMDQIKELLIEEKKVLRKINNTGDYLHLYISSFKELVLKGRKRSEDDVAPFQQLLQNPLLKDEKEALSYTAKVFFHSIHANYNDSIGNDVVNNKHQQKLIELLESNPKILKSDFSRYITFVDNFCISGIRLGEYDKCLEKLAKLKELYLHFKVEKSPFLEARIFTTSGMHQLCAFYRQGKYEEGLKMVESIEKDLETYNKYILTQRKHDLMYDLFYTYFGTGNFNKALFWLNACINDKDITMRPAEISSLKILEIIIHYELGNDELISFLVRNSYRFLLNKGQLYASEALFLKFIRTQLPQISNPKELKQQFIILKQELLELQKDPYEQQFLDPFDMIRWLNSKIEGKSFGTDPY